MTLHVPFEQFSKTVARLLGSKEAYVSARSAGAVITAGDGQKGVIVVCNSDHAPAAAKSKLSSAGLEVYDGVWKLSDDAECEQCAASEAYIAAVAYKSAETMPGVWVDAHRAMPTQVQVLRAMYDEFRETGELPDVSFEEFVRLSEPNVVIVSPNEIQSFLDKKPEA